MKIKKPMTKLEKATNLEDCFEKKTLLFKLKQCCFEG
jgi:hypothetical protein